MAQRYLDLPKPRLLAHRGASQAFPENSLPAFVEAAKYVPYLELDVRGSSDKKIVIHHDETLQRTCGAMSAVRDLPWNELAKLHLNPPPGFDEKDGPFRLCLLEELFATLPEKYFNIEIKQTEPSIVNEVLDLIVEHNVVDRCLITAEVDHTMLEIRNRKKVDPKLETLATGISLGEGMSFLHWLQRGASEPFALEGKALQIPEVFAGHSLVREDLIRAAHALGIEVHYWVVNDEARMKELLDLGADGIVSDSPASLSKVAAAWAKSRKTPARNGL